MTEVIRPHIAPGMKQAHDLAALRVDPRQVGAFAKIAVRTSEAEVICAITPAVLARNDVLNVETQLRKLLRQSAVLTPVACPRADQLTQCGVHD